MARKQYKGLFTMDCRGDVCPQHMPGDVMAGCINCPNVDFLVVDLAGKKMAARNPAPAKLKKQKKEVNEYIKK